MIRIKWLGHKVVVGLIGSLCLTSTSRAQIRPVSTFTLENELWLDLPGADSSARAGSFSGIAAWGFVEVPFGTPELQISWFGVSFTGHNRTAEFSVSRSGFDELHQTDLGVTIGQRAGGATWFRMRAGSSHFGLGRLGTRFEANWSAEGVFLFNQSVLLEGGARRRSGIGKKGLGPSELFLRSLFRLNRAASLSARLISTATHSLQLEASLGYSLAHSIQFDVGFESSRSMLFLDLRYSSRSLQAGLFVSYHPVLGRSVGSSLRWVFR